MISSLILIGSLYSCVNNKKEDLRTINRSSEGNIISIGDSLNGKRVGEWIFSRKYSSETYDTSVIKNYENGVLHGITMEKDLDHIWSFCFWKNGKKNGFEKSHSYFDKSFKCRYWKNDELNGPEYEITASNDSLFNGYWKMGTPYGIHTKYFKKETLMMQYRETTEEEFLIEASRSIELDNRIEEQYHYNDEGELNGSYVSFAKEGFLIAYGQYKDDDKYGIWLENFALDNITKFFSIGLYKNGLKEGYWLTYRQKFKYQINSYEENDQFFISERKKVRKEDYYDELFYKAGEKIKVKYYREGHVFNSDKELKKFNDDKIKNFTSGKQIKSTYSY